MISNVFPGNIPTELKALDHWVNWRFEESPDRQKPLKVPLNPETLSRAKTNDSATWGTFEAAAKNISLICGLGFVFSEADPYAGADFDDCLTDGTVADPEIKTKVIALNSYTELSNSGQGLHTIIRTDKTFGGRKNGSIEAYSQGRYFCFTGDVYGEPKGIRQLASNEFLKILFPNEKKVDLRAAYKGTAAGNRNDTLARLTGSWANDRLTLDECIENAAIWNSKNDPPLSQREVEATVRSIYRKHNSGKGQEQDKPKAVVMAKFYPRPFTDEIKQRFSFVWEGTRGALWRYNRECGLWTSDGEAFIDQYFRNATAQLDNTLKRRNVIAEIVADVAGCSYRENGLPEPSVNLIPFDNGVYDLKADTFRNRRPEDYFTWALPWRYNPNAKSTFLKSLISDTLPEGDTTLMELAAYCLWRGYPYQKFWLLVGPGSNGKGVFLTILTRLLGPENISGVSLREIQTSHFAAGTLHYKLANISGEADYSDLANTSLLKQLTGGDQIQGDRKYLAPIKFVNYGKLIFATNQVPVTRDSTDAFYRRAFLVEFPKTFRQDPTIDVRIREDSDFMTNEFEGLLYDTVRQLRSLVDRRFIFTRDEDTATVRARYEALSNPLKRFISENCQETFSTSDYVYKYEFRERLNTWLVDRRFNSYTDKRISREMADLGHESGQRGEKQYRAWLGLNWFHTHHTQDQQGFINHSSAHKNQFEKGCGTCVPCVSIVSEEVLTTESGEKCPDCSGSKYDLQFHPETRQLEKNCNGQWCFRRAVEVRNV